MRRFAVIIFIAGLLWPQTPAHAQIDFQYKSSVKDDPFYAEILNYEKINSPEKTLAFLSQRINAAKSSEELQTIAIFLTNKTYHASADNLYSNYFLIYSDALFMLAQFENGNLYAGPPAGKAMRLSAFSTEAMKALMYFEMLSMVDSTRCADETVWPAFKKQIIAPRVRQMIYAYADITPEDYRRTIDTIIAFEAKHRQRAVDNTLCTMGEKPPTSEKNMLVDPLTWYQRRDTTPELLKKLWMDRYKQAGAALQKQQLQQQSTQ